MSVTKSNSGIVHSTSLILQHGCRTIDLFPSVAQDSRSSERTAMHLLKRVTNKISCVVRVSANMAALALLGAPSDTISCQFFIVYVEEAVQYVLHNPDYKDSVEGENKKFKNLSGDEFDDQENSVPEQKERLENDDSQQETISLNPSGDPEDISTFVSIQDGVHDDHPPAPTGQGKNGRPSNGTFSLAKSHPLFLTREARL
uniref:Uncharacterized protein n=1 Tax=Daphnia galeata TaxID=27404 RepID=A0A8J2RG18_9CRUS|nr:unnamed protein product [Daphnia galeata]